MTIKRVFLALLFIFWAIPVIAGMEQYCASPPFLTQSIDPNVVLVMDYSGSMQFPAYYACANWSGYYESQVAECYYGDYAYENYNTSYDYYGIFDSNKYYKYDSHNGYFVDNTDNCSYSNKIRSAPDCVSGNLLNFVTTTRIDAALKALIGGKADCGDNYCYIKAQGSRRRVRSSNIDCDFYVRPEDYSSGNYADKEILLSVYDYDGTCPVKGLSSARVKLRISKEDRGGLLQSIFDSVRITFMVFGGTREGEIRYGFNENNLDSLLNKLQSEVPYGGTPSGEALWEAYDYLKQRNGHNYESNSNYINDDSEVDPYYQVLEDGSLVSAWCRQSNVVLISDGEWNGNVDPVISAYHLRTDDLRSDLSNKQTARVYSLYAFDDSNDGKSSMKTISAFGGFTDISGCNNSYPYTFSEVPDDSLEVAWPRSSCPGGSSNEQCCKEWDEDNNGVPDGYFAAENGAELEEALRVIFVDILKRTASGTSASLPISETKIGKNLVQALFYPKKQFDQIELDWIGYLYTYWFYYSPTASNIREDTIENKALDVCTNGETGGDYIVNFLLNNSTGIMNVKAYKSTCSGTNSSDYTLYSTLDDIHPVWEAGEKLKNTNATQRNIYTYTGYLHPTIHQDLTSFQNVTENKLFGDEDNDGIVDETDETTRLITKSISIQDLKDYILGNDIDGYRNRSYDGISTWKLGDIIYSTPKIVIYDDYSVVYVGANDGMLHAFRLGKPRYDGLGPYQDVRLCNDSSKYCYKDKLGEEMWAYIPKNSLPYLRALTDPKYGGNNHLYYVDLMPYIIELNLDDDSDIEKRILIGGMRFGGAVGCTDSECINPPADTCADPSQYNSATSNCVGLSSYFALDITNATSPKFLWEFTDKDLGFTYTGPAFIKVKNDDSTYSYFIMFASGPTNYRGESKQDLKFFVLKLESTWDAQPSAFFTIKQVTKLSVSSEMKNAFGGRLFTEGIDVDKDGDTDWVFIGSTRGAGNTLQGDVWGIHITGNIPSDWEIVNVFNSSLEPVTAKVEYAKCFDMNYIFFGTGRYFYPGDDPGKNNEFNNLYAVRIDDCLDDGNCNINAAHSSNDPCNELTQGNPNKLFSWKQGLNEREGIYFKERVISDPTVTDSNIIYFTTTEPSSDFCSFGGRSRVWQLNCATGEDLKNQNCPGYHASNPGGKLFLQLSRGNIEEIIVGTDETSTFNDATTPWYTGVPPESATPYVNPAKSPKGNILLWIEK